MSERPAENSAIVRRIYAEVLGRGRLGTPAAVEAARELFDPEVRIEQTAELLGTAGTFLGLEGLVDSYIELAQELDGMYFELERLAGRDDQVAAIATLYGRGHRSGTPFCQQVGHLWTLREGRVKRWIVVRETDDALRSFGLSTR